MCEPALLSRRTLLAGSAACLVPRELWAVGWTDRRSSPPFDISADFSLAGYEGLFGELTQLQRDLIDQLHVDQARENVEIYLFRNESTYRAYVQQRFADLQGRKAFFVKGKGPGRVYTFVNRELGVNVRHEGTHALLHSSLPLVPLWLDEGLAEYFESPVAERASGSPHLGKLQWGLRVGMAPRIVPLEAKRELSEMTATDYRFAWAWVHFMLHGPAEAHEELIAYLGDIQASTPPGKLSERLERRLPSVERRLVQHFKTWK